MEEGYVKIFRSLLSWEWFEDSKTLQVWIYILLRVQYEDTRWRGIQIRRGQMLESLAGIAENTGMSVQSVRTAISHLKSTHEITCQSTRYGMLINVIKWADFQGQTDLINTEINTESNKESTRNQQRIKKEKKVKKKEERVKREDDSSSFSPPSLSEISLYVSENHLNVDPERFWLYYQTKAWKGVTDWSAALLLWSKRERPEKKKDILPKYMEGREEGY